MIRAVAWSCEEHQGIYVPGRSSGSKSETAAFDRPIKNLERFTGEARHAFRAAAAAGKNSAAAEIGLLAAGTDGVVAAEEKYFRDYVVNGRTLGRGNLFIYTLGTSVPGEISIALSLTGPCLFIRDLARPVEGLVRQAEQMVSDGEANEMRAIWSEPRAAVCLAMVGGEPTASLPAGWETDPLALCNLLRTMVKPT